ncbi:MAG: hypothetical protein HY718_17660 [Planctomycetes bacterium]|nr:hypothetical protein [Planctomycetota bacterium]
MRAVGVFLRYVLNINTVWGVMILAAFVLCVVQHYRPSTTVIPAGALHPGNDLLTIRITPPNKESRSFDFVLDSGPQGIVIPQEQGAASKERPWLISASRAGAGFALTWDYNGYGKYEMALNGNTVAHGQLVTLQSLTDAAFEYAQKGFDIALGLVAAMVLFLGLMKVGEDAGIVQLVANLFHPIIRFLFPQVPRDHPANGAILMNVTTSILGLGNAATPFGLKAMKELQSLNPHPDIATDAQVTLLAYNTAGLALLPTTLLAVRKSAGCNDPFEIIGTCLIAGATSTVVALTMARLLARVPFFTVRAALAEGMASGEPPPGESAEAAPDAEVAGKEERP